MFLPKSRTKNENKVFMWFERTKRKKIGCFLVICLWLERSCSLSRRLDEPLLDNMASRLTAAHFYSLTYILNLTNTLHHIGEKGRKKVVFTTMILIKQDKPWNYTKSKLLLHLFLFLKACKICFVGLYHFCFQTIQPHTKILALVFLRLAVPFITGLYVPAYRLHTDPGSAGGI